MHQSHVIEVSGTFVGAAITTNASFRFLAVHVKVEDLDQSNWRSLDELKRAVTHLFTTGRVSAVADPLQSATSSLRWASATGSASWMG